MSFGGLQSKRKGKFIEVNHKKQLFFRILSIVNLIGIIVLFSFIYADYKIQKNLACYRQTSGMEMGYGNTLDINSVFHTNGMVDFSSQIRIIFSDKLQKQLADSWDVSYKEYTACIKGYKREPITNLLEDSSFQSNYYLTEMRGFREGKEFKVPVQDCNTMAMIHKHPDGECSTELWTGDIEGAKKSYKDGVEFFIIQCDFNKVEVYSRENLWKGILVVFDNQTASISYPSRTLIRG